MVDAVKIEGLTVNFGGRYILRDLSLSCAEGRKTGISGPIGGGKSTLLKAMVGLVKPDSGDILLNGLNPSDDKQLAELRGSTGYLFQDSDDQLFCSTVEEDVAFGLLNQGKSREEAARLVDEYLHMVGLDGYQQRVVHHLSGGEKRLAALASILVMEPDLLLLDEPFNFLDQQSVERVEKLLLRWPGTVLMVSHGRHSIMNELDEWYTLEEGTLIEKKVSGGNHGT